MKISIVIPVLNEEKNVLALYDEIVCTIKKSYDYEIIFVDDGSRDSSEEAISSIKEKDKNVKLVSFTKNFGKSAALTAGFRECTGNIVFMMDADLQDDPKDIPRFIEKLNEGYDTVNGWRYNRKDKVGKLVLSYIFNKIVNIFTGLKLHDINCGFKCFKREVIKNVHIYGDMHRYIVLLLYWEGYRIAEIKVNHRKRSFGISKYSTSRIYKGFIDLFVILFTHKYKTRPLLLFGIPGILSFFSGFIIGIYMLLLYLRGYAILGRPLFFLMTVLIIMGLQLISLGLLGEILVEKDRLSKQYIIKSNLKQGKNIQYAKDK